MENVEIKQEIKNSDDGKGILITNDAIEQISSLLKGQSDKKALRVGVRSGGCSGMSYTMDFIGTDEINSDDKVYDYSLKADQNFQVVCDPKSILYIYGMQLDFSKELIEKEILNLEKSFLKTKYLVTGTILLSSPISSETIFFLLEGAKEFDVKIVIDLNWREVFWDHSSFSSEITKAARVNLIKKFLNHANVLKLAKEEATLFFEDENPLLISQQLSNRPDVIITDGKNPIEWHINGLHGITDIPTSQKIVDTTGAGDAFLAGLISKLISSGYPSNKLEIEDCIIFAGVCGLLTCLGEGAIEQQPYYEKVIKFLGSLIS